MQPKEFFAIWAPKEVVWSRWAKPVVFSQLTETRVAAAVLRNEFNINANSIPTPDRSTFVLVNLPGVESVELGVALAQRGYRLVPLYNCCEGTNAIIPMAAIIDSLVSATPILQQLQIPLLAPPAFLIDANRMRDTAKPSPGDFDNRWLIFPEDFPSGKFLLSQGIQRVLLLQRNETPESDLAHVLLRWQQQGIQLLRQNPLVSGQPLPLIVSRPRWFRYLWYRALTLLFLRRNSAGGFGSVIPDESSTGGG
ncbi:hypothetical protein [Nostoc sp. 106C]|uniref:hypothetical protein n=1 Tax=Nostoc sp. 106C TaxID=1932667 RepID=UPI000A39D249|nr:hypothetical protein [Nostoc sp. 106C]OUL23774.1 hypothetical protein BV375_25140 [Nostoc sp. 106C]